MNSIHKDYVSSISARLMVLSNLFMDILIVLSTTKNAMLSIDTGKRGVLVLETHTRE